MIKRILHPIEVKTADEIIQLFSCGFNPLVDGNVTIPIDLRISFEYDIFKRSQGIETANDLYKKLLNKADTLSTKIESAMLQENVNYNPIYDLHDSVNEIVDKYIKSRRED